MLQVYPHDIAIDQIPLSNGLCILNEATDVLISQEINGTPTLTFSLPAISDKWQYLQQGNFVVCDQQLFRVFKKSRSKDNGTKRALQCLHVVSDATRKLILYFDSMIAKTPKEILTAAFAGTQFEILDTLSNGMTWVTDETDFLDPISKTNPLEIVKQLIDKLGKGELYIDNYKIALVDKIISNTSVVNATTKFNAKSITDEEDGGEIITRLYPFGKNDLVIAGDTPYIDSPMQTYYGIREGYKDYSDVETQTELLEKAQYEFSDNNPQRIDLPNLCYTISLIDLCKVYGDQYKIGLGDSIKITDTDLEIDTVQRVISYEYYPYEPKNSNVTLGRPSKTFDQAISSLVATENNYKKTLDDNGNVKVAWLENLIKNQSEHITDVLTANEVTQHKTGDLWIFEFETGNKAVAIVDGQLAVSDSKNSDGTWNWETFIDGKSITASLMNTGTLNTNLVNIESADGKMSLKGTEIKMTAEDGSAVYIRSTDGTNGIKKGLQIIQNFNEDGTPKTYSIYDSSGYRRYINNAKIQTYTISAAGNGLTYSYNDNRYSTVFFQMNGDYFFEWATAYNLASSADRAKMLNLVVSDNTQVQSAYEFKNVISSYNMYAVKAVEVGDSVYYSGNNYFYAPFKGAYIVYEGGFSYDQLTAPNIWTLAYQPLNLAFMANTTMDI